MWEIKDDKLRFIVDCKDDAVKIMNDIKRIIRNTGNISVVDIAAISGYSCSCNYENRFMGVENEKYEISCNKSVDGDYTIEVSPLVDLQDQYCRPSCHDNVSNPSHYTDGRSYEPRKIIRDWDLNFNLGNVVKYISRAGRKGDILEDLLKARQYLDFEIEALEEHRE